MRAAIEDAVAAATAPLAARLEALEGRLGAVEDGRGTSPATEHKRPSTGRAARTKAAPGEKAEAGQ